MFNNTGVTKYTFWIFKAKIHNAAPRKHTPVFPNIFDPYTVFNFGKYHKEKIKIVQCVCITYIDYNSKY